MTCGSGKTLLRMVMRVRQAAFFGAKSLFVAKDLATHCEREPCKVRA